MRLPLSRLQDVANSHRVDQNPNAPCERPLQRVGALEVRAHGVLR